MQCHRRSTRSGLLVLCLAGSAAGAQPRGDAPAISAAEVAPGVHVLAGGRGANSTLLVTDDGALLIDSKLDERNGEALLDVIGGLTDGNVLYLINSHVHPDHTGGNAVFGRRGVLIVGHEQVRTILAAGQRGGPPAPAAALPSITFADGEGLELHIGGEVARIRHMPAAHTTDNSMIQFVNANVFHLGDLYGSARYPVLAGGTLEGFIDAIEQVLAIADDDAVFVPGVGDVTGVDELGYYLEMLKTVQNRVSALIDEGKSLDEVIAARPTAEFDATFGTPDHPLFLPVVYEQLAVD
jgi:cyclase